MHTHSVSSFLTHTYTLAYTCAHICKTHMQSRRSAAAFLIRHECTHKLTHLRAYAHSVSLSNRDAQHYVNTHTHTYTHIDNTI